MTLRLFKLTACAGCCLAFIAASLMARLICLRASRSARNRVARRMVQRCSRALLAVLKIRVSVCSMGPPPSGGCLLVSNHQSYLDVLVIAAIFPVQFVAKSEIANWPVIGWLAALAETIFIDRGSPRRSARRVGVIADALRQGSWVQVFPEATSTDGGTVQPFKPLLFRAALQTDVPLLPLTINYLTLNGQALDAGRRDACCWYGEMDFLPHFWRLLAQRGIEVSVEAQELLNPLPGESPQALAQIAHKRVRERFIPLPTADAPASLKGLDSLPATS